MVKRTNQHQILRILFRNGRKMTVEAISKETTLEKRQVYDGVRHLRNRGLVTFSQKLTEAEYKVPPHKTIFIEMKEKSIKRIRELIK